MCSRVFTCMKLFSFSHVYSFHLLFKVFVSEHCQQAKEMRSPLLQSSQSQDAMRSLQNCLLTPATSFSVRLCIFVGVFKLTCFCVCACVRVCLCRVFPHLESELCFPILCEILSALFVSRLHSHSLLPHFSSLSGCFLNERSRKLDALTTRELDPKFP